MKQNFLIFFGWKSNQGEKDAFYLFSVSYLRNLRRCKIQGKALGFLLQQNGTHYQNNTFAGVILHLLAKMVPLLLLHFTVLF